FERALSESATAPPMCELVTETIMAVAKTPWRWILQELAEDDEKELLEAILEECQTTGKVVDSLPEDDALIRKLHAEQVLRTTLVQLDDQPVRPTGLRHGQGEVEREREEGFWESLWGAEPSDPVFSDQPLEPAIDDAGGYVGAGSRRGTVGGLSASYSTGHVGSGSSYSSSYSSTHGSSYGSGSLSAGAASRVPLVSRFHGATSAGSSSGSSSGTSSVSASSTGSGGNSSRNEPPLTRLGGGRASSRFARPSMLRRRLKTLDDDQQDSDSNDDDSSDSRASSNTSSSSESSDTTSRAGRRRDGGQRRRFDGAAAVAAGAAAGLAAAGAVDDAGDDESDRSRDDRRDDEGDSPSDETPKLTRRARLAGMFRGMASKVMEKAAATAGKVRGLVRRRPKRAADDSSDSPDAASDSATSSTSSSSDRQRLVDDGESSGANERSGRASSGERAAGAKASHSSNSESQDSDSRDRNARSLRFNLELDQAVEAVPSIGPKMAKRLENQGVGTVAQLLEADAEQVAARLGIRSIDAEMIRTWQRQSELMCRVPELRGHDAQVLVACGVVDAAELAAMDPASLFELIEPFLGTREADQILRGSPKPDLDEVADWIEWAQSRRDLN
ncbi:MAG TPA: DUF4332 domain-containing protein, partial [Pirellulaceae bacterium]|nr:DUF4332 domain-containing protein [Pirellulaceae bacterium]